MQLRLWLTPCPSLPSPSMAMFVVCCLLFVVGGVRAPPQLFEDAATTLYDGMRLDPDNEEMKSAFEAAIRMGRRHHAATGRTQG